jgi:hypothetical protein
MTHRLARKLVDELDVTVSTIIEFVRKNWVRSAKWA